MSSVNNRQKDHRGRFAGLHSRTYAEKVHRTFINHGGEEGAEG